MRLLVCLCTYESDDLLIWVDALDRLEFDSGDFEFFLDRIVHFLQL